MKKLITSLFFSCFLLLTTTSIFASNAEPVANPTELSADNVLSLQVLSLLDVSCFGLGDGAVTVTASGGLPPYIYTWSNGMVGPVLLGLQAGVYTCTVTDLLGATAQLSVTVEEPLALNLDVIAQVNVDCGHPKGSVTVESSGGTGAGIYLWSNGATTPTISNLNPGIYICTVTDQNLCIDVQTVEITADLTLPAVNVNASVDITCLQPEVVLNAAGSATGSNIAYLWTTVDGHIVSGANTLNNCTVDDEGTYTLTVTNLLNSCTDSESVDVDANVTLPAVNIVTTGGADLQIDCLTPNVTFDGTGTATGNGISYLWTTANGHIVSGANSLNNCVVDAAGSYTLAVTNALNGCSDSEGVVVTADVDIPLATIEAGLDLQLDCISPEVVLSGEGSATGSNIGYLWTTTNGHIVSGANSLDNCIVDEPGTYLLTITDILNGCTADAGANVTLDVTLPTANVEAGANIDLQIDCLTPEITLSSVGSSTGNGISYLWTTVDGHIVAGANTMLATVDAEGSYLLQVTNGANGCTATDGVDVTVDLDLPIASIEAGIDLELNCLNANLTLSGEGSSAGNNFIYLWTTVDGHIVSGSNTLDNCVVDEPGTYILHVSNSVNGCESEAAAIVTLDLDLPQVSINVPDVLGCQNSTVVLNASASSHGPGYLYLWTTVDGHIVAGANTLMATVNAAGTYELTITSSNGCTAGSTVVVIGNPTLDVSVNSMVDVSCFGEANGAISLTVSAGTGPYTYTWSNGMTGASINGLSAGMYTATVTDDAGCAANIVVEIGQPDELTASATATGVSMPNGSNGTATATATGGTAPYTYLWSNGMTTAHITGLAEGTYSFTITDANGCTDDGDVEVPGFGGCLLTVTATTTSADCGGSNGTATAVTVGGSGNLQYTWSNGMTGASVSGLAAGSYTVTVSDGIGCTATASTVVLSIDVTPPVVHLLSNLDVYLDANGNVDIPGNMLDNGSTDACGNITITVTPNSFDCDDLGQHTVTVTVTDANGNTATGAATITVLDNLPPVSTCPDDMTVADCSGLVNYPSPTLTDNCSNVSVASTIVLSGLASGSVFPMGNTEVKLAVIANTGEVSTCVFNVNVTGGLDAQVNGTAPTCAGMADGSATVTVSGGTGIYTYFWVKTSETTPTITGLAAGVYDVIVTDNAGCVSMASVELEEPTGVSILYFNVTDACGDDLGSIDITVTGGVGPYTFAWYDANGNLISTEEDLVDVPAGNYTVEITDTNGCTFTSGTVVVNFASGVVNVIGNPANVDIFPNPTSNGTAILNIEMAQESEVSVELYSMTGQWVATVLPAQQVLSIAKPIDLSSLAGGSYMLKVLADQVPVSTQKLVYVK